MTPKQASSLAQKLCLLISINTTNAAPCVTILPGKAADLISLMESLLPWPSRLTLLWLVCALPCQHQQQLLMHHGSKGMSCLHGWLLAADNVTELIKREALQLALLQTFAVLGQADHSLVQPWMVVAARELVASSPLRSVRLAAMKLQRLSNMQAVAQTASSGGSSTDNNRPMCVCSVTKHTLWQPCPSCLASLRLAASGHRAVHVCHLLPCLALL